MDRRQEKRIIYIYLLGFAAIMPLLINPGEGALLSIIGVSFVLWYIISDVRKSSQQRDQRGFDVITKQEPPDDHV